MEPGRRKQEARSHTSCTLATGHNGRAVDRRTGGYAPVIHTAPVGTGDDRGQRTRSPPPARRMVRTPAELHRRLNINGLRRRNPARRCAASIVESGACRTSLQRQCRRPGCQQLIHAPECARAAAPWHRQQIDPGRRSGDDRSGSAATLRPDAQVLSVNKKGELSETSRGGRTRKIW